MKRSSARTHTGIIGMLCLIAFSTPSWGQLQITTADPAVAAGNQLSLTASGGTAPYTWSLAPGSAGSINTSTGEYTAPATVTV
ncbi:MAG: hypothetical protein JNK48_01525, partial [Bryobacterales bacterium]|nr:hypothetical protein [Bryobacterales bacterium]